MKHKKKKNSLKQLFNIQADSSSSISCKQHNKLKNESYVNELYKMRDNIQERLHDAIIEANVPISNIVIDPDSEGLLIDAVHELALKEIAEEKAKLKPTLNSALALSNHVISILTEAMGETVMNCEIDHLRQQFVALLSPLYGYDDGCCEDFFELSEKLENKELNALLNETAELLEMYADDEVDAEKLKKIYEEEDEAYDEHVYDPIDPPIRAYFRHLHSKEYRVLSEDDIFPPKRWVVNRAKALALRIKYEKKWFAEETRLMYKEILVYRPIWELLYREDIEEEELLKKKLESKWRVESKEEASERAKKELYIDDEDDDTYYCEIDGLFDEKSYTSIEGNSYTDMVENRYMSLVDKPFRSYF